jgi:hypothetical protein
MNVKENCMRLVMITRNLNSNLVFMKYSCLVLIFLFTGCATKKAINNPEKIEIQKIWDQAPHSAFTDLLRFNNAFFCTFREGPGHVSGANGTARVLKSQDGKSWQSLASFKMEGMDVRDPKLSVTPDKRIMILLDVETYKDGKVDTRKPFVSYSDINGNTFSQPVASVVDPAIAVKSDWVWRVTWHNGTGYAIDYQPDVIYLVKTTDGKHFQNVSKIDVDGRPNESTIRFDKNGKMYVLIRREDGDKRGILATSDTPFKTWQFNKLEQRLGGPNFIFLDDQTLCIGSRYYPSDMSEQKNLSKHQTAVFITDLKGKTLKTIPVEQSGGDTSYPGMLVYQNQLWYSYYSSHEGKTSVYLAKIPLKMLKN